MTDERRHGHRGVIRHSTPIAEASATAPAVLSGAPASYDATFGRKNYGMQGNDAWSNCWWAMLVHMITVQATTAVDEDGRPTFVPGFTPLGPDQGVEWYNQYQTSQGQAVEAPGQGTDPYQGALLALKLGLVYAIGTMGPPARTPAGAPYFDPNMLKEVIYDTQGGCGFLLALTDESEVEFDDGRPWGSMSVVPDQNDGHATDGVKYQQGNPITFCITWAEVEGMEQQFDINCIEGLTIVLSHAFVLKNGQAAADALVAKWGLQTATAAAPATDTPPASEEDATAGPTANQLADADLVAVATWQEIEQAYANNQGPLRTYDSTKKDFPPVAKGYVTKPKVVTPPPPVRTFTATQTGLGEVTVEWNGFSPIELARNGVDVSGFSDWNTGPLTDEPTSGSFTFDFLVPGDTYTFTATAANGGSLTATCAVTTPATKLPTLGINGGGLTWGGNTASNTTAFALMKKLGATLVRIALPWNYASDSSWLGFYNADKVTFNESILATCNETAALAKSYGLTVLWLIDGLISIDEPASGAFCYTPGLPYTPASYAEAVAWFAKGVPGSHIEEINEPNGFGTSWKGPVALPGSTYAIALEAVWNAAKAADPTCKLHMGPVSDILPTSSGGTGWAWRQAVATALANWADFIDYDGVHTYMWPTNLPPTPMAAAEEAFVAAFVTKPWWKTEFGYDSLTENSGDSSPEMTATTQALYLVGEIQADATITTPPEAVFVYCLADYDNAGTTDGLWGIVDSVQTDGNTNPKPAFAAIQALYA